MGKKKAKSKGTKPWYSAYNHLNLSGLITGVIPKLFRSIDGARARLNAARTAKAANVERRHIKTKLAAIDEAYSKIRKALRDGGDMYRWREFPGLEAVVQQVNNLDWSKVQVDRIPGGPFKPKIPMFHDDLSFRYTETTRSSHVTTGPAVNGNPFQKPPVKDEVKVEEGEIKEEDEVKIKHEPEDGPGVPEDIRPPEHLPSPDSASPNHGSQHPAHPYDYLYQTGFGACLGSPPYWMPQFQFLQPVHPPKNWQPLPKHLRNSSFPAFYLFIPYYNFDLVKLGFDGRIGRGNPQFPYGASHPQLHATRQHLIVPVPAPPGNSPGAFQPSPSFPPPSPAPSPILPSKPSPAPSLPTAQSPKPVLAKQTDGERGGKRKRPNSPDALHDTMRPLKRHVPAQRNNMSGADDNRHNQTSSHNPQVDCGTLGPGFKNKLRIAKSS